MRDERLDRLADLLLNYSLKLKKGDLICFYSDNFSKIGHIGIVISSSMMIDASSSNGKVVRREYKTTYWKKHFYCGRRPW